MSHVHVLERRVLLAGFSVDNSFGADPSGNFGGAVSIVGGFDGRAHDVVVQPDGKIIVVGAQGSLNEVAPDPELAVVRLHPDGRLDTSFSGDGRFTFRFEDDAIDTTDAAAAVALAPDGKIVVAGNARDTELALLRLNADGTPDETFGAGGFVAGARAASDVVVQPDGGVVVATTDFTTSELRIERFNADGSPDSTWSDDGAFVDAQSSAAASSLALQPDGKLLSAGAFDGVAVVRRFNVDGTLDPTFGTGGSRDVPLGDRSSRAVVALADDGRIVVAGATEVARLMPDGTIDLKFGGAGTGVTNHDLSITSIATRADGKIWLATTGDEVVELVRLGQRGRLDGRATSDRMEVASAIALAPDGDVVMAGNIPGGSFMGETNTSDQGLVVRFDSPAVSLEGSEITIVGGDFDETVTLRTRANRTEIVVEGLSDRLLRFPIPEFLVVRARLGGGNDSLDMGALAFALDADGQGGNDTINGGWLNDTIQGGIGQDSIFGSNGHDILRGGASKDRIVGGYGIDELQGEGGNDYLWGAAHNDHLVGGPGDDTLKGGQGKDLLSGVGGNDILDGGSARDRLFGGAGNDTLLGGTGDDGIFGDGGNDFAFGSAGDDAFIMRDDLADTIDGGAGLDQATRDLIDELTSIRSTGP